ncbi:MAG TPA: 3-deoxy-D-manno-octulosonic acid transferase [Syntrophobacteraceae bacterium]|nr:3-deoxy-D-manno-octulosonic acid transferase [Syntrophobacteraceae bacterium]
MIVRAFRRLFEGEETLLGRIGSSSWLTGYRAAMTAAWPFLVLYYFARKGSGLGLGEHGLGRLGLALPSPVLNGPRIWIHALSVGETLSAVPLVQSLKALSPETRILFSSATATGWATARERLSPWVSTFFVLPHDFPWTADLLVSRLKPRRFVLVETDLWPHFLRTLRRRRVPAVLVNGRLSERSYRRFLRFKPLVRSILEEFECIFPQSDGDASRFLDLGVRPERIRLEGNLKFDSSRPRESREGLLDLRREVLGDQDRPAWIAGSTHPGEEEILLDVHASLRRDLPELLLILAPRQPRRGTEIGGRASARGFSWAARSTGESAVGKDVYVLDTLGELGRFYGLADAAFIGGSLVPFGGHNPLEAAAVGKPTVWGSHMSNFRDMEAMLLESGCAARVDSGAELLSTLRVWLGGIEMRKSMGTRAKELMDRNRGCSERIALSLLDALEDAAFPGANLRNEAP